MIKLSELRIGNMYQLSDGTYGKVESIYPDYDKINIGISSDYDDSWTVDGVDKRQLIPIPLTIDILLKAGFIKDKHKEGVYKKIENDEWDSFVIIVFDQDNNIFKIPVTGFWRGVYTVHQLQNFYFAITGEEISIDL